MCIQVMCNEKAFSGLKHSQRECFQKFSAKFQLSVDCGDVSTLKHPIPVSYFPEIIFLYQQRGARHIRRAEVRGKTEAALDLISNCLVKISTTVIIRSVCVHISLFTTLPSLNVCFSYLITKVVSRPKRIFVNFLANLVQGNNFSWPNFFSFSFCSFPSVFLSR